MECEPTSIEEMFGMIDRIQSRMEDIKPMPHIDGATLGVPIQFVLVPIDQFFDVKIERLYLQLKIDKY
jgi:hypothetical protein